MVFKIGNRRSSKHYRIYTNQKKNLLKFEAEMKCELIKDFQYLLITFSFDIHRFEIRIAYQFFKYSFGLFCPLNQFSYVDWLIIRIRSYQHRNTFELESVISSHCLNQMNFKLIKEKQHLVTLLRLLAYVKKFSYTTKSLRSKYRRYTFSLRNFLNYNNLNSNHYQIEKLKTFFDLVKQNFVIESFLDEYYQILVIVREIFVYKSEKNILIIEIWIAEELSGYVHSFLFFNLFQQKLNKQQFQILFEIIKTYSFIDLRKEFNITQFLNNYPSVLNNQHKKQIQEYFIHYLKILH